MCVTLPVIVSLSYAAENVYIAKVRPRDCSTLTIMCGLSRGALLLLTPAIAATDALFNMSRLGPAEQVAIAIATLHRGAYFGFIWLIDWGGSVFAAQVGYFVTGSSLILGMLVYGEQHALWTWMVLASMFARLSLVQPKR